MGLQCVTLRTRVACSMKWAGQAPPFLYFWCCSPLFIRYLLTPTLCHTLFKVWGVKAVAENICHSTFMPFLFILSQHFPLIKNIWDKGNMYLPYDLTVPLLSIYQEEMKIYICQNPCTRMLIPAFFVIAPNWKQHRYPSPPKE